MHTANDPAFDSSPASPVAEGLDARGRLVAGVEILRGIDAERPEGARLFEQYCWIATPPYPPHPAGRHPAEPLI